MGRDGNVLLNEWASIVYESIFGRNRPLSGAEVEGETKGELEFTIPKNLTTWIFEDGTFIPMAKLQGENSYSIVHWIS